MKERAYAKINLCLDVAGRRDDGYHELKMIMVPINFYDVLEMTKAEETTLVLNRAYLPVNEKNTIIKAIRVMQERFGVTSEYACKLQKHIPTRAGLAGGSADAAAAIRMIAKMERLNVTRDELIDAAKEVGADVPFCLLNRPAYVSGIGEKIIPFTCHPDFDILLVKPRRGVSTKDAFDIVDREEPVHPDCEAMRKALIENDYQGIVSSLGNSLESAAVQLVSEIRTVKEKLTAYGFDGVLMSGSGSTVFAITKNEELLEKAIGELRRENYFVRRTNILGG